MDYRRHVRTVLPEAGPGTLLGRVFDPEERGPSVVTVRGDRVVDLTAVASTTSELLDRPDVLAVLRDAEGRKEWPLQEVLDATLSGDASSPHLLAPIDLQVIKAAGVTFAKSMIERVIEERAKGDATKALELRSRIDTVLGGALRGVKPGSPEAEEVKRILLAEGLWSQYLEVGIGPDPEIFTKAPVLSAVGTGQPIGVLERSTWNNPEPEVVLAVTSDGRPVGATLGNDVNLRDFEGRSALLLTEAKDNNASCAIGPFIRVFDAEFGIDDVRRLTVSLHVDGPEGFTLRDSSSMSEMSRELEELVSHAWGSHHRYPDGFVLFTGTLFAPTQDRDEPGSGFTHRTGDIVTISTPALGTLVNEVMSAEAAPDWRFGIRELIANLAGRGLLGDAPR
ncbi:fumarylacetoacetate (FAA) hydrolase family protein [Diaminobutyricimonas aerilata]|uniref:Fumarylacetoacetate (FAA) hydrolase family protein n=1 Tax=Diaminobutyricimonas aerilata TaxID=1162967 RepID=A0A2M9CMC4_9MICO|nr:fumarylacetoacetate hydrolase family protein [Diaminobutyricimonas aerilata]PJJ73033.1 fumarylacetoacetate (FAA) hydrolase family protein [Diaminobutyricimonas aerilata]